MKKRILLDTRLIRNLIFLGEARLENITSNQKGNLAEYRTEMAQIKRTLAPLKAALEKGKKK